MALPFSVSNGLALAGIVGGFATSLMALTSTSAPVPGDDDPVTCPAKEDHTLLYSINTSGVSGSDLRDYIGEDVTATIEIDKLDVAPTVTTTSLAQIGGAITSKATHTLGSTTVLARSPQTDWRPEHTLASLMLIAFMVMFTLYTRVRALERTKEQPHEHNDPQPEDSTKETLAYLQDSTKRLKAQQDAQAEDINTMLQATPSPEAIAEDAKNVAKEKLLAQKKLALGFERIAQLENTVSEMKQQSVAKDDRIAALERSLTKRNIVESNDTEKEKLAVQENLSEFLARLMQAEKKQEKLAAQEKMSEFLARLEQVESKQEDKDDSVEALKQKIAEQGTSISELKQENCAKDDKIATLEQRLTEKIQIELTALPKADPVDLAPLQKQIDKLEKRQKDHSKFIDTIGEEHDELAGRVNSNFDDHEGDLENLKGMLENLKDDKEAFQQHLDQMHNHIQHGVTRLLDVEQATKYYGGRIGDLHLDVNDLQVDVNLHREILRIIVPPPNNQPQYGYYAPPPTASYGQYAPPPTASYGQYAPPPPPPSASNTFASTAAPSHAQYATPPPPAFNSSAPSAEPSYTPPSPAPGFKAFARIAPPPRASNPFGNIAPSAGLFTRHHASPTYQPTAFESSTPADTPSRAKHAAAPSPPVFTSSKPFATSAASVGPSTAQHAPSPSPPTTSDDSTPSAASSEVEHAAPPPLPVFNFSKPSAASAAFAESSTAKHASPPHAPTTSEHPIPSDAPSEVKHAAAPPTPTFTFSTPSTMSSAFTKPSTTEHASSPHAPTTSERSATSSDTPPEVEHTAPTTPPVFTFSKSFATSAAFAEPSTTQDAPPPNRPTIFERLNQSDAPKAKKAAPSKAKKAARPKVNKASRPPPSPFSFSTPSATSASATPIFTPSTKPDFMFGGTPTTFKFPVPKAATTTTEKEKEEEDELL